MTMFCSVPNVRPNQIMVSSRAGLRFHAEGKNIQRLDNGAAAASKNMQNSATAFYKGSKSQISSRTELLTTAPLPTATPAANLGGVGSSLQ